MATKWGIVKQYYLNHVDLDIEECIIWPYGKDKGYGIIHNFGHVHVKACERYHGPRPENMEVCHNCGNRACFNPKHLRWDTHRNNSLDRLKHGTIPYYLGGNNPNSKLNSMLVIEIKELYKNDNISIIKLARKFNVTTSAISSIINERTWKNIQTVKKDLF